jgi:hypothetical protein
MRSQSAVDKLAKMDRDVNIDREFRRTRELVKECRQLWTSSDLDGSSTWVAAVKALKLRMVDFLLRLGPDYADIRDQITTTSFIEKVHEPELDNEGVPTGHYAPVEQVDVKEVRRATKLLITVAKRIKQKCPSPSNSEIALKVAAASGRNPLSEKDEKLHKAVGDENFRQLDNKAIWNVWHKQVEPLIGHSTVEAFRARLNRIRKHYQYPASEEVRAANKACIKAVKSGQK